MSPAHPSDPTADSLLILPAGTSQHEVIEQLRGLGFVLRRSEPRTARSFLTYWFERDAATVPKQADTVAADVPHTQLGYQEDPLLGQRLLWLSPPDPTLADLLAALLGGQALPQILVRAAAAETAREKIAALGPLVALLAWQTMLPPAAIALLRQRLADSQAEVRRATLFVLSYLPFPEILDLLREQASDPLLAPEIARQLSLRGHRPTATADDERRRIEDEIAAAPLRADAYLRHAQRLADLAQPGFALAEAQIALALARRDGSSLREPLVLIQDLRPQLSAVPTTWLPYIAQRLSTLLALGRPHVVVEVADQLLPALGTSIAAAPVQLALALAHRQLGRSALALSTLLPLREALLVPPASPSPSSQAAAAQQVVAEVQFLSAQLSLESAPSADAPDQADDQVPDRADDRAPDREEDRAAALSAALVAIEQALAVLPDATLLPAPEAVQDLLVGALLIYFPAERRVTARALRFARMQALAEAAQTEAALAVAEELLNDEPAAADVWLARAALHLQRGQAEAALQACAHAEKTLAPIDRVLEDIDPLAILRLRQATAHAQRGAGEQAAAALLVALDSDARVAEHVAGEPALSRLLADSPTLTASLQASLASLDEPDPQPRTAARHAAAACLRQLPPDSALATLLLDFVGAGLLLLDRAPPDRRAAAGMTLLASLEAQLDLLSSDDEAQAQSAAVHVAMAAMADALGL